uniref:Uncharacterized protein n=1 Tax=viral metagenome TaxID=1070528 RepID=A0A6C0E3F3_9ZZZZ
MKKCPPGVICIENVTMGLLLVVVIIVLYMIYKTVNPSKNSYDKIVIKQETGPAPEFSIPSYPYNNLPEDVLLNPYVPPLKDERYFVTGRIPINVSTNIGAVDTSYRQLGILTPLNGPNKDNILPLMGRPLFTNRQKYQYYTISNQHNNIKLPISVKGKSGTNEYGVDQIFNGDTVYIEGYNDAFRVTTYDTDTIKYLPYL